MSIDGKRGAGTYVPSGGTPSTITGTRLSRPCPRCKARPGEKCQRFIIGTGSWRKIKQFHDERSEAVSES